MWWMMEGVRELRYEMDLPFRRDSVWDAWTTRSGAWGWLGAETVVDTAIGGRWRVWGWPSWFPGRSRPVTMTLLSIDRPRLLDLEVSPAPGDAVPEGLEGERGTRVTVRLTPSPDGSRLVVCHEGFDRSAAARRSRRWFGRFWASALENLRMCMVRRAEDGT
jgi:uncharacterized protein YndB with AHSA1/START domain